MTPTQARLVLGLLASHRAAISDRCNRWAVHQCVVPGCSWRPTADALIGICPVHGEALAELEAQALAVLDKAWKRDGAQKRRRAA